MLFSNSNTDKYITELKGYLFSTFFALLLCVAGEKLGDPDPFSGPVLGPVLPVVVVVVVCVFGLGCGEAGAESNSSSSVKE